MAVKQKGNKIKMFWVEYKINKHVWPVYSSS